MVIGVLFSGFVSGLLAMIAGMVLGLPLWAAILLYPPAGFAGCLAFLLHATTTYSQTFGFGQTGFAARAR